MELKDLFEDGLPIECTVDGKPATVRVLLSNIVGDNLGLQTILGFHGFRTDNFCRFCLADQTTMQQFYREDAFELRTPENYEEHCK